MIQRMLQPAIAKGVLVDDDLDVMYRNLGEEGKDNWTIKNFNFAYDAKDQMYKLKFVMQITRDFQWAIAGLKPLGSNN
jgi:hypothetical protein